MKSEIGNTRIMIDSVEDILKLESYIVAEYDSVLRALDEYRANKVNADEEIKKYLNTMV